MNVSVNVSVLVFLDFRDAPWWQTVANVQSFFFLTDLKIYI